LAAILGIITVAFVACAGTTTTAVGITTVQDADAADKPR
jgi:hypothetical protein